MLQNDLNQDREIIKSLDSERINLINITAELNREIKDLKNMLRSRDELTKEQKKQIEELNQVFKEFDLNQRSLELKISEMSNEIKEKNYIALKESRIRLDRDEKNENLEKIIKEKDKEIKKIIDDLDFLYQQKDKLYEDNSRMFNELDRLKKHIYIITDQNQQVIFKIFFCLKI